MVDIPAVSRSQSFTISELAKYAKEGRLRIPEFQRGFRWSSKEIIELFDSIRCGYPIGNALLWLRIAPPGTLQIGDLVVEAVAQQEAFWVVDGQQRITSLINGIDPDLSEDSVFAIAYLPKEDKFVRRKTVRGQVAIPLADLFSIPRLFTWLQENPDGQVYAEKLQTVTTILRDFSLPASIVESSDELQLRKIFDRINNAGKRLTASEVFDAINRTTTGEGQEVSVRAIADRLAVGTTFGRLPEPVVLQAFLIRRHPDLSRDAKGEFDAERRSISDFPEEDKQKSLKATELALRRVIQFLENGVGVPHYSFLPQRFLLLILVRFFSLFPEPTPRSLTLLSSWFWRAASRASLLGLTGAVATVRPLAARIQPGGEHSAVQGLLDAVKNTDTVPQIDVSTFRSTQAASKIMLCGLWSCHPRRLDNGELLTMQEINDSLEDMGTPRAVIAEIVPSKDLNAEVRSSLGNRLILSVDDNSVQEWLLQRTTVPVTEDDREVFRSHMLEESDLELLDSDPEGFIRQREIRLSGVVDAFIKVRTSSEYEDTPSLTSLIFDDEDGAMQ